MTVRNFPSNGGGAINGIADSGIQIFAGKEIPSLARETCQNSLLRACRTFWRGNVKAEAFIS